MDHVAAGTDILIHVAMGIALAACAGLRAFLPLFVVGLAGRVGWVPLSGGFDWLASDPALIAFGIAVAVELAGDKFPVVDSFLDAFQTIVKPVVGAMLMLTVVSDWAPLYLTIVWIIMGGTVAGLVHVTKAKLRLLSTATTAGIGSPVLSTVEDVGALAGVVGALVVPLLAALLVLLLFLLAFLTLWRLRRRRPGPAPQSA